MHLLPAATGRPSELMLFNLRLVLHHHCRSVLSASPQANGDACRSLMCRERPGLQRRLHHSAKHSVLRFKAVIALSAALLPARQDPTPYLMTKVTHISS